MYYNDNQERTGQLPRRNKHHECARIYGKRAETYLFDMRFENTFRKWQYNAEARVLPGTNIVKLDRSRNSHRRGESNTRTRTNDPPKP